MNNQSIKLLVESVEMPPDEILDLDKSMREREAELPDEVRESITKGEIEIIALLSDPNLAHAMKLSFAVHTIGELTSLTAGIPLSEVFLDLASQYAAKERIIALNDAFNDFISGVDHGPAPDCPECGVEAFWCFRHRGWECPNGKCPHMGLISTDED